MCLQAHRSQTSSVLKDEDSSDDVSAFLDITLFAKVLIRCRGLKFCKSLELSTKQFLRADSTEYVSDKMSFISGQFQAKLKVENIKCT